MFRQTEINFIWNLIREQKKNMFYPFIEDKRIIFIVIGVCQLCQFIVWPCGDAAMRMTVMTAVLYIN